MFSTEFIDRIRNSLDENQAGTLSIYNYDDMFLISWVRSSFLSEIGEKFPIKGLDNRTAIAMGLSVSCAEKEIESIISSPSHWEEDVSIRKEIAEGLGEPRHQLHFEARKPLG